MAPQLLPLFAKGIHMKKCLIIAALAGTVIAQPVAAQEWDKQQTEVWTYVADAWTKHNTDGTWSEALDPNGYGWNGSYPVPTSKAQMKARNDVFRGQNKVLYYQLDPIKISVNGDAAIAFYYASLVETNHAGKRESSIERCADTLVKRQGKWHFLGWNCSTKTEDEDD